LEAETLNLNYFFYPRSIAVIGASNDQTKLGYEIYKNLKSYSGKKYPVNIREKEVLGDRAYARLADIEGEVDLAIIAVPREHILNVVKECGEKGVKGAVIITAGFSETNDERWKRAEIEIVNEARKSGVRLIGPNCVGIMNTKANLNATFIMEARPGKIAFVSQSGALGAGIIYKTIKENIGFSKFISLGNMADLDFTDLLEYLSDDQESETILLYLEGVKDGRRFALSLKKASLKKPVIVIKGGKGRSASEAVSSHTGSVSGSWEIYRSALRQSGALIAESIDEALSMARAFSQPLPRGKRVGIITNAGGAGVLVADQLEARGLEVPRLSEQSIKELKTFLPPYASFRNPVDMIASARGEDYKMALEVLLKDDSIDIIVAVSVVPTFAGISREEHALGVTNALRKNMERKPVLALFMAGDVSTRAREILEKEGVSTYERPEDVSAAAQALYEYSKVRGTVIQ
jgi:acetyl coenzyme A synthetase (ADP forming)-like protein